MAPHNDIVLFHYPFSPYARRIVWYLTLRGIDYAQCIQPPTLPRPDISALGVSYRRIPLLSIGRDIYCDTRLIIAKLETLFPDNLSLSASTPEQKAIERLLSSWTIDGGIFVRASQAIPPEMPLLNDPKFKKDREEYTGQSWSQEDVRALRPEALAHLRDAFDMLETGLLADGRQWILGTERPSLADIEAIWPFHWLLSMKSALPPTLISPETYPLTHTWITRFNAAVSAAKSSLPKPTTLSGPDAVAQILKAEYVEPEAGVEEGDPIGLKRGMEVESWPVDSGWSHRDRGRLVGLSKGECVLQGEKVRIHHPRWNFRIREVRGEEAKL